jgi:aminodeoxyfutalosine deaminase
MTLRDFITALPKVELNLQLTGALRKESLQLIANQNGIPAQMDDFAQWLEMLEQPDPARLDEIAGVAGSWVMYPEDIALVVYDIGVALSKQNVRYAEISVVPSDFIGSARMNFDTFINALNDGRDRALRAWNVDMSWILCIPRENPRAGDDVARWATGTAARQGNVVALGLVGNEDAQPVGQFRRAFGTAQKKGLFTVASAGSSLGADGIREAVTELQPSRLVNSWLIVDDETLLKGVVDGSTPIAVSMSRALKSSLAENAADLPLKHLLESNAQIVLSCDKPSLYKNSLVDEYVMARDDCGISVDQLVDLARRAIPLSFMDADRKESMLRNFDFEAESARTRFLSPN